MKIINGKAYILFEEQLNAYLAKRSLNNHEITEDKVQLKVEWCEINDAPEYFQKIYINALLPALELKTKVVQNSNMINNINDLAGFTIDNDKDEVISV